MAILALLPSITFSQGRILAPAEPSGWVQLLELGKDLNGNGLPEYLLLQSSAAQQAPTHLLYCEDTGGAQLSVLWRHQIGDGSTSRLVDAALADLDGDGRFELLAAVHFQTLPAGSDGNWLSIFSWDAGLGTFSSAPTATWNYRGKDVSHLRPLFIEIADLNGDGNHELVVGTGSPDRMILVAGRADGGLRMLEELRPSGILAGAWPFTVVLSDFDGDRRDDILVVSLNPKPKFSAFLQGRRGFHEVTVRSSVKSSVIANAMAAADLNGDGQEQVVAALTDGTLASVSLAGRRLRTAALDFTLPDLAGLLSVNLDSDGPDDLVYLQTDGTVASRQSVSGLPLSAASLVANQLQPPLSFGSLQVQADTAPGLVRLGLVVRGANGSRLVTMSAGTAAPPVAAVPEPAVAVIDTPMVAVVPAPEEPFALQEEASEIYLPTQPMAPDPRALPPNRTPDILLYEGQEFSKPVLGTRAEQFAGFRFLRKPPGMVFNFQRQEIVWRPTAEHLGAWNVEYEITYQTGVRYQDTVSDSVQEFKVVPEEETVRDRLLLYVNDPPRITSQPESVHLLAGHLFAYRVQVDDRNSDAKIDFRLESGPEGMILEPTGILTWRTNESNHDDYQAVISIFDGFDKDVQTLNLNVNAQLTITSTVPHQAAVGTGYVYPLSVYQPGSARTHIFTLLSAPDGMTLSNAGLINWTPTVDQVDTQHFQIQVADGVAQDAQDGWVYVNAQPRIVIKPVGAVVLGSGDTLTIQFGAVDANAAPMQAWSVSRGPVGMTIDSTGLLTWATTLDDLDAIMYTVEVSDGIDVARYRGLVFLNSPVTIASAPPDSIVIGATYRYAVDLRDLNQSALMKFRRPTVVSNIANSRAFRIAIQDDRFRRELGRYLAQFKERKSIYVNKPQRPDSGQVAEGTRIDLKVRVSHAFMDEGDLILVLDDPEQGVIALDDVLWELFQGGRGIMPKYRSEAIPFHFFTLEEFPDGMEVDDRGIITWTPTPGQAGHHQVRFTVTDGYTRDNQAFQIYANYPPAIISNADTLATVEERYAYQVRVDDRNDDAQLSYSLTRYPDGMQIDPRGLVTWTPAPEHLNNQVFEVVVSDGFAADHQAVQLFVNIPPRVLSQPKPVALNSFEYTYRLVAEDLNRDPIRYKAIKIPRYSDFDPRTGLLRWRPRNMQKGPNEIAFEITDTHGGTTIHQFQVHVFEDPGRQQLLFTGWPLLLSFAGVIFVLGMTVGG